MRLFGFAGEDETLRHGVVVRLVAELSRRHIKVATVHEAPPGFDPDKPGKDSYEHRKAGASEVLLMAPHLAALMHENGDQPLPSAERLAGLLSGADLVLIDGFEHESHPKARVGAKPCATGCDASVIATLDAADIDIGALADLVLARAKEIA